jgi:Zn-dependent M28 family amino/carboxypeptidase
MFAVKSLAVVALSLAPSLAFGQAGSAAAFTNREPSRSDLDYVRAQLKLISDDLFEGRAPGTRGGNLAARYLASQLELLGLEPGGDSGTYFQRVPLLGIKTDYGRSRVEIGKDGATGGKVDVTFLEDFVFGNESEEDSAAVDAEMVFVGYGIVAPEQKWDDYKGVDVKGKVLLMLVNDPPSDDPKVFGGKGLTYYGRWTYKYEEAARRGAVGAILMHRDDMAAYGWNVVRTSFARERPFVDVRGPLADGKSHLPMTGWASEGKTRGIVELAGKKLEDLLAAAAKPEFTPVPLGVRLKANVVSDLRPLETSNVIGVARGSKRPSEAVIFSAHYDHLGVDPKLVDAGKDGIFNGSVDNGTGCAALLWLARETKSLETAPDRSFVFLFTTAEEGGLRGSQYYATHPTFPKSRIAADINLDALTVFGEPLQFEPLGYDRSTLKRSVELAAREFSVELLPDSSPEAGSYYRSDHFPFAQNGVPSIHLRAGKKLKGVDDAVVAKLTGDYSKNRYHQPSDEFDPTWDFSGIVKTARFAGRIGWRISAEPEIPHYDPGDEFAK